MRNGRTDCLPRRLFGQETYGLPELFAELLSCCAAGEPEAVARLVQRCRPWSLDLAEALTGDPGLAEDAVQEAFLIALARLGDLRQPEAFPAWFRQIVRSRCSRIRRRRREEPCAVFPDVASNAIAPGRCRRVARRWPSIPNGCARKG